MARAVRGPVCGVNNCPSRLWKRINGQNVCQYGHINEGDIEIDDEDDFGEAGTGVSKRISNIQGMTTNSRLRNRLENMKLDKLGTRKYGKDFELLKIKCFQIILVKNTKHLILKLKISNDQAKLLIQTVKLIWVKFLHYSNTKSFRNATKMLTINLVNIINYLAITKMNLPLYLVDFAGMTIEEGYNFQRSELGLPKSLRLQIPYSHISVFHGRFMFDYFTVLRQLHGLLENSNELNYYPLLLRTVFSLKLPLQIVQIVHNAVDLYHIKFKFDDKVHPELKLNVLIMIFTRIFFMEEPAEYSNWRSLQDSSIPINSFNDFKKSLSNLDFNELNCWTNDQIDNFLNFYNANMMTLNTSSNLVSSNPTSDRIKLQIIKSVHDLFPVVRDPMPSSSLSDYKEHLLESYQSRNLENPKYSHNDHILVNTLIDHIKISYNCPLAAIRDALWKVHLELLV